LGDRVGSVEEGKVNPAVVGRKKKGRWKTAADRRVPHVGDFKPKTGGRWSSGRARLTMGRQAAAGLGPRRMRPAGREGRNGPRSLGREESRPESRERIRNPFPIFQIHFSNDFQIKFEFNLNHSIQNFKCSSMNAQSCFYPYI
jgi:hypothetical protein